MCPKLSFWLMLRLAVLLAAVLVQSSEANYQRFARQHIEYPKTRAPNNNAYCNLLMRRRGMTSRACKPTNTVINSSPSSIQQVCRGGGRRVGRHGNIYESRRRFRIIECRGGGRPPNCQYRGRARTRRIQLGCVNGLPVHYQRAA